MIWFFERKGEHLRCEIRQQLEGDRFALVATMPDGTERVESFEDSTTLNRRSLELEKILRSKGWAAVRARYLRIVSSGQSFGRRSAYPIGCSRANWLPALALINQ